MSAGDDRERTRDLSGVLARHAVPVVLGLLGVVFAVAAVSGPSGTGVSLPEAEPPTKEPGGGQPAAEPHHAPTPVDAGSEAANAPLTIAVAVLLCIAGGLLLWGLVRLLRWILRHRREGAAGIHLRMADGPDPDPSASSGEVAAPERVRAAVTDGLQDLDETDGDPRRAVIGCWLRLETAAAGAGTPRRDQDTAADLTARLRRTHHVSEESLHRLAELYRRARYAPDEVATSMRDEARHVLSQLSAELARGRKDGPDRDPAERPACEQREDG